MKKKKGKVYPSPPQSQSPSSFSSHNLNEYDNDSLSVLKLLPEAILVLVSILSAEDREVLAYLIMRGTTTISESESSSKKNTKKKSDKSRKNHKPPVFDCECFDCYTNYWLRWDSSQNRNLIHEIIEAFENHHHLTNGEEESSKSNKGKKKKEKPGRRVKDSDNNHIPEIHHVSSSDRLIEAEVAEREPEDEITEEKSTVIFPATGHRGLARKVLLPDVLGLFNSSFWRLWNPNA